MNSVQKEKNQINLSIFFLSPLHFIRYLFYSFSSAFSSWLRLFCQVQPFLFSGATFSSRVPDICGGVVVDENNFIKYKLQVVSLLYFPPSPSSSHSILYSMSSYIVLLASCQLCCSTADYECNRPGYYAVSWYYLCVTSFFCVFALNEIMLNSALTTQ